MNQNEKRDESENISLSLFPLWMKILYIWSTWN